MNWQQKAAALNALSPIKILMRGENDWYVSQSIEVKDDSGLISVFGNGDTPENAITDHWEKAVSDLCAGQYLVLNAAGDNRRAVEWNGFMWADVVERKS